MKSRFEPWQLDALQEVRSLVSPELRAQAPRNSLEAYRGACGSEPEMIVDMNENVAMASVRDRPVEDWDLGDWE